MRAGLFVCCLCLAVTAARAQKPAAATGGNLTVTHPVASQSEDGPPIQAGEALVPGETIFFSFEVAGFATGTTGKVQLTGHVQAFDPKGVAISMPDEQLIATTLAQEDKDWKPKLRSQFVVPSLAPAGSYKVRFDVTDGQTKKKASGEAAFPVRGRTVAPASEIVVRNLAFYRTQDDESPLRDPLYRAGDLLWARLDITGYAYGEQNSIDVSYDVEVLAPGGKSLFSQADAAVERSQSFYPQPWVPGEFNLSLQTTMTPGAYTLVITAHDGVAKKTATARAEFRVQ